MSRRSSLLWLAVVPLVAAPLTYPQSVAKDPATTVRAATRQMWQAEPQRFTLLGAGSCASVACHNQDAVSGTRGREYALCLNDKHDQAYRVLLTERSRRISARFHGVADSRAARPEHDLLCLKCHVHPGLDRHPIRESEGIAQFRLEDGVSCEACHGAAGGWLEKHHRGEWRGLSAVDKKTHFGMNDTQSVAGRARTCVACHVGAPGMEVDHDLIAAGHPRLAFEFSGYHALLTHHWDDHQDRDPTRGGRADFEFQAWAQGQLVSLDASLELLAHRLRNRPWPEFAEFDCQACHHDLTGTGKPGAVLGRARWNDWYASPAGERLLFADQPATRAALDAIRAEMQRPSPRPDRLAEPIARASAGVHDLIASRLETGSVRESLKRLLAGPGLMSWDAAVQLHAGVRALEAARLDLNQPEVPHLREALKTWRQDLVTRRAYPPIDLDTDRLRRSLESPPR